MQTSYKSIWLIAYPVLLSLLVEQLIGMTDTAFLGRLGEIELGASALAGTFYMIFYVMGSGFGIGAQILMARLNGEKKFGQINSVFLTSGVFLMALATFIILASQFFSPLILRNFISSPAVYSATVQYLDWRFYGLFFSFLMVIFRSFFVATAHTKILTLSSIIMVLTNVVCNYALIFGNFGFPRLGIAGAAIGSSIAELVACVFLFVYVKYKPSYQIYNLLRVFDFSSKLLKRVLTMSVWTMIQALLALSTWFLFFIMIEHLGERSLAIANIIRNISAIPFMFIMAFGTTGSSLISNLLGEGKQDDVMAMCRKVVTMCYCFILPILVITCLFPVFFLRIYTDDITLINDSISTLYVMLFSTLVTAPGFIMNFTVSGTGNTRPASLMEFLSLIVYVAYISYVTGYLKMNIAVSWTAEYVYGFCLFLFSGLYMWRGSWKNKKI